MKVTIRSKKAFNISSEEIPNLLADVNSCLTTLKRYNIDMEAIFKIEK